MKLASLAVLALLGASVGGAAPRPSVTAPAPVAALSADAARVAFVTGRGRGECDRVRIWNRATGRVTRLGRATSCVTTSTGTAVLSVSLAGNRAVWLHYTGGNIREWSLFTATTTAPRPRQLAFLARDVDEPAPIVLGEGSGSRYGDYVPYAVGSTVIALSASGRRALTWTAPARVTALSSGFGGIVVASADGRVTVLEPGIGEESFAGAPPASAVFLSGDGVVVQRGRTVELRSGTRLVRTFTLPAGARVTDAYGLRATVVGGGRVRLLNLQTGALRAVARGTAAQLDPGLVYASGRQVRFVSAPALP